jgi:hypothetical protein
MKLIGSRTGGYEYWVKLPSGLKIWFGQRDNSDTDILLSVGEKKPEGKFDIFYGDPIAPYVEDNRLIVPRDFDYLMFPLCIKLINKTLLNELMVSYQEVAEVENLQGEKVGEIYLEYSNIPNGTCQQMAIRSKKMKARVKEFLGL